MFLWAKAFHIIFMVCWFAGIFYLPRLFVHHVSVSETATRQRLSLMEGKLYRFVTPFMLLTIVFGLWLFSFNPAGYLNSPWFLIKLALIALLVGYHLYCGICVKRLREELNRRSHVFYRVFNELPVLVLFAVVILAVVKPG